MNIALIFAGGFGTRMNNTTKPKQFLKVCRKEIIIHTIENFEYHPDIDSVIVVCVEAWISFFRKLVEKYNLTKVKHIIPGGRTGQESIYNGISIIKENYTEESIILIHDGVRPFINKDLISRCIQTVIDHGTAITISPVVETIISISADEKIEKVTDRSRCFTARAPQCFKLADIWACHERAISDKLCNVIDSASLMYSYGYSLYPVLGPYDNIKITSPSDYYLAHTIIKERKKLSNNTNPEAIS